MTYPQRYFRQTIYSYARSTLRYGFLVCFIFFFFLLLFPAAPTAPASSNWRHVRPCTPSELLKGFTSFLHNPPSFFHLSAISPLRSSCFFSLYAGKTSRWNRVPLYLESVPGRFPLYWKWQSHLSASEFRIRDPLTSFLNTKGHIGNINWGTPYGNCTGRKPRPCIICKFVQSNAENLGAFKKGQLSMIYQ